MLRHAVRSLRTALSCRLPHRTDEWNLSLFYAYGTAPRYFRRNPPTKRFRITVTGAVQSELGICVCHRHTALKPTYQQINWGLFNDFGFFELILGFLLILIKLHQSSCKESYIIFYMNLYQLSNPSWYHNNKLKYIIIMTKTSVLPSNITHINRLYNLKSHIVEKECHHKCLFSRYSYN